MLEKGTLLAARYYIETSLGRGSRGEVFLAQDQNLNDSPVVVKVLHPHLIDDKSSVDGLVREAMVSRTIVSPYLIRIFDLDYAAGNQPFTVMEYHGRTTLKATLASRRQNLVNSPALTLTESLKVIEQITKGVSALHAAQFAHRDIKSSNIILDENLIPKISDFGAAVPLSTQTNAQATSQEQQIGSMAYMAPELWQGEAGDAISDLYALGAVIYEIMVGFPPFSAQTSAEMMWKHLHDPIRPPHEIRPSIPRWLSELTNDLLTKDPSYRIPRAQNILEALSHHRPPEEQIRIAPKVRLEDKKASPLSAALSLTTLFDPAQPNTDEICQDLIPRDALPNLSLNTGPEPLVPEKINRSPKSGRISRKLDLFHGIATTLVIAVVLVSSGLIAQLFFQFSATSARPATLLLASLCGCLVSGLAATAPFSFVFFPQLLSGERTFELISKIRIGVVRWANAAIPAILIGVSLLATLLPLTATNIRHPSQAITLEKIADQTISQLINVLILRPPPKNLPENEHNIWLICASFTGIAVWSVSICRRVRFEMASYRVKGSIMQDISTAILWFLLCMGLSVTLAHANLPSITLPLYHADLRLNVAHVLGYTTSCIAMIFFVSLASRAR